MHKKIIHGYKSDVTSSIETDIKSEPEIVNITKYLNSYHQKKGFFALHGISNHTNHFNNHCGFQQYAAGGRGHRAQGQDQAEREGAGWHFGTI